MDKIEANTSTDIIINDVGATNDLITRQEYVILTSTFHLGRVETTPEERKAKDQEDPSTGHLGVLMDSIRSGMKFLIDYINNEMKALERHFDMVLQEVMETWAEQCQMGVTKETADLANNDGFISKMFLKGDLVVLILRLRPEIEENDTVNTETGSEDISRMSLGSMTIGQVDGWRAETHLSCHDSTLTDPETMMMMSIKGSSWCIAELIPIGGPDQVVGEMEPIARWTEGIYLSCTRWI